MSKINYQDIDVEEFLNDLGMHNVRKDGREVFFSCPFEGHNHGDLNPSASMRQGDTVVHCFGCGFNGNALTFVAEYENVSPLKAARYIREYLGDAFKEPEGSFLEEINKKLNPAEEIELPSRNKPLNKSELNKRYIDWREAWKYQPNELTKKIQYMFDRGFSWETLEEWNIGFDDISQRITIPWIDESENLIGFKGRALDEDIGDGNARYKVLGGPEYGFDTFDVSLMFFGEDKLKTAWKQPYINVPYVHLVEGELNVLAMWQMGFGPCLGISGKHLSDAQIYILKKMNKDFYLFFDDISDACKAANKLINTHRVYLLPEHDKDPADSTPDEIRDLLSRRKSAIMIR